MEGFYQRIIKNIPGSAAYKKEKLHTENYIAKETALQTHEKGTLDLMRSHAIDIREAIRKSNSQEINLFTLIPGLEARRDQEIAQWGTMDYGFDYMIENEIYDIM